MKKLIVLFALASVAAAVACGGGDNKPANDPSTSTSSGDTSGTGTAAPAGSGSAAPTGSATPAQ